MDDGSLLIGSSRASGSSQGGWSDASGDRVGAADQPVVRVEVDAARAGDGVIGSGSDGYKPRTLSGACADWLRERIASGPVTLRGLTAELAERGIKPHPRAVWVFLHAEGLSFKKTPAARGTDPS